MKNALFLAAVMVAATASPVLAVDEHRHGQPPDHDQLSLDHGQRWATDEPLRRGMAEIRTAMADSLEPIHLGEFTADQYHALGTLIRQQVGTIVAQCKLAPEADAMLHVVIADLMAGSGAMHGEGETTPVAGAHRVVEALNAYGEYFIHPGWHPLP